jgi:hypothetical protein
VGIDQQWIDRLLSDKRLFEADEYVVEGVPIELPMVVHNTKLAHRHWQRRVIDDILPDSPNADASEKIPFRILKSLTTARHTTHSLEEVVAGEFAPIKPIFWRTTKGRTGSPVAFHVLAVRGTSQNVDSRAFTERTFLLLLRDKFGHLDEDLLSEFIERFRIPTEQLDLAQQYVLEEVHPEWDRDKEFTVEAQDFLEPVPPFMQDAADLFQNDITTLLDAKLPAADHFQHVNVLFALHLGLYLPRLAYRLNGAMMCLEQCLDDPDSVSVDELSLIERGKDPSSRFEGRLSLRAPSVGSKRRLPLNAAARVTYEEMNQELAKLHFSLLLFHRVRELAKSYIRAKQHIEDAENLFEMTRYPSQIAERLQWYEDFRSFLKRSLEALVLRFVDEQLDGKDADAGRRLLAKHDNPLRALRKGYEIYNFQPVTSASNSRAYRQGTGVCNGLLKHSEYGIIQSRRGVGAYFELGVGLIPLLLLLVVGSKREKIAVDAFWQGLAKYGLHFAPKDRDLLLSRLKSMGLYERFSDAGEANYIRNLLVGN